MALWFLNMRWGRREDIAIRMRQHTNEYLITLRRRLRKALFTYVSVVHLCTPRRYRISKARLLSGGGFFGGNTPKADVSISVTELGSLLDHTRATPGRKSTSRGSFGAETELYRYTEHRRRTKLWYSTPRHPAKAAS